MCFGYCEESPTGLNRSLSSEYFSAHSLGGWNGGCGFRNPATRKNGWSLNWLRNRVDSRATNASTWSSASRSELTLSFNRTLPAQGLPLLQRYGSSGNPL